MSDGICSQRSLRSRSNRRLSEGLTAGVTASPPKRGKSDKENVAAQKHTSSKRRSVPIRSNVLKGASLENKSNLNTNNIVLDSGFQSFKSENSDSIRNSQDDNASTRCTYTGNVSTLHKEKPSANYDTTLSDTSDEDCEDFETRRLQNIEDNAAFLQQLKLDEAVRSFKEVTSLKPKQKSSSRGLKLEKKEVEVLPRRKSLRLQRIDPLGNQLPPLPEPELYVEPRKKGKIVMKDVLKNVTDEKLQQTFLDDLCELAQEAYTVAESDDLSTELKSYTEGVKKMKTRENLVCKVVPDRIFSLAIHPAESKILVCAGGKWGKLGMWDVHSTTGQDGVFMFEPHTRPIRHMAFQPHQPDRLYSLSYDGTVRKTHFEQGIFDEVFALSEDDSNYLYCFDFHSPDTLLVSDSAGDVSLVDQRTPHTTAEKIYNLHKKKIKCISVHPTQPHYFVTSGFDSSHQVCVWDIRHLSTKTPKHISLLRHGGKSVESAFFSPITGKSILTTSLDDNLRIFDSSDCGNVKVKYTIRHNNHTGRWLTPFRAVWHPRREDVFVVIQMFNSDAKLLHTFSDDLLASVASLNVVHPTLNIIAGGNSSGRVTAFVGHDL